MTTQDTIKHILDVGMLLQDNTVSKEHRKQLAGIVRDMGKSLTLAEVQGARPSTNPSTCRHNPIK